MSKAISEPTLKLAFFAAFRDAIINTMRPRVVTLPKFITPVTPFKMTADSFRRKYTRNGTVKNWIKVFIMAVITLDTGRLFSKSRSKADLAVL